MNSATARRPRWGRATRNLLRWIRNGMLGLLGLLSAATLAGRVQQARLQRAHPAPGGLVDVGGHELHVLQAGAGGPTVVFENGQGGMALDWHYVQPEIAAQSATLAYDRAGMGWSEPGPGPRDLPVLVDELRAVLHEAGAPTPYVLVGHSLGGPIVRAYAHTYPDEVAGLVLLDATHEDQFETFPAAFTAKADAMAEAMRRQRRVIAAVNASGIPALFASAYPDPVASKLPAEVADARRAVKFMDASTVVSAADEMIALRDSLDHLRRSRQSLGDIPVVVLPAGKALGAEAAVPEGLEGDVEAARQTMQEDLATVSTNARRVVADGSGHFIHVERPDLVTDAVRQVLEEAAADA
ncbi:alpha/beta fold hydrolase [Egibacter rhizosphaerae]|nr:alpha/beta hydrolase [Egibacter rhizosphaerae]